MSNRFYNSSKFPFSSVQCYNSLTQLRLCTNRTGDQADTSAATNGPPAVPSTCCMSGCANCVWLDYAEEMVNFYEQRGEQMDFPSLLRDVEKNIDDPMIKAFITMELKSKYLFRKT